MDDKTYFTDSNITVTASQISMGSTFYSLRNVSSVRIGSIAPSHSSDIFLIVLGILLSLPGFCLLGSNSKGAAIVLLIFGIGFVALGGYLWSQKKNSYTILIGTNSGEKTFFVSKDQQYVQSIVGSISQSIADYGKSV